MPGATATPRTGGSGRTSSARADRHRGRRADGERTRGTILREATRLATVVGLEGLTIGGLADAIGMSKSGLYAHFGSKEALQLATIDEAGRVFDDEVIGPALAAPAGRPQIIALCDAFFQHLRGRTFPGGCFFAGAVLEMGTRSGPVRDRIAECQMTFTRFVRELVVTAIARGELGPAVDPDGLTFELNGIILAADAAFVLRDDPAVLDLAAAVVRSRLAALERTQRA